ncbi:hypothetical protein [Saccharothrix xinjiangensis]|uniref:Uncharacterized protein n=1 Tax=Saccharothrix xinjiangensis TaxID=204798 RepID=A0ABV9YCX2_9PSEU
MEVRNETSGPVHGAVFQSASIGAVHLGPTSVPLRVAVRDPRRSSTTSWPTASPAAGGCSARSTSS